MQALKSLIYIIGMVASIVVAVILMLLAAIVSRRLMYKIAQGWNSFGMWFLKVTCGLDYVVEGLENIPQDPRYIIFSKHQSAWETMGLQDIFKFPVAWILKRGLLWVPFFGWGLKLIQAIGINRGSGRQAVEQLKLEGKQRLDNGIKIIIFPEGTRIAPGKIGKFKIGGSVLAEHTGAPIVPVAHNAGYFWRRRGFVKYPGTIRVRIGKPIATQGKTVKQINQEAYQWMVSAVEELGAD